MQIYNSVIEIIGNTPIIKINNIACKANIFAKCEFMNPAGSIKDRIAYAMIKDALDSKLINKDTVIIEPTSGNTGIGLASVCASLGLKLVIVMPESMSLERRRLISFFGAQLELTPKEYGMKGAIDKANELKNNIDNSFILDQFSNKSNPRIHMKTTAVEILEAFGDKQIDILVAGVGTGGSISGIGEVLKSKYRDIKIFAVEPSNSPVLNGGKPGAHNIQGIGAGFIPKNLNTEIYDEVLMVDVDDAYTASRELAFKEGLLVGISSGANFHSAKLLADKYEGSNILTIFNDTGERYLSTELF